MIFKESEGQNKCSLNQQIFLTAEKCAQFASQLRLFRVDQNVTVLYNTFIVFEKIDIFAFSSFILLLVSSLAITYYKFLTSDIRVLHVDRFFFLIATITCCPN